MKLEHLIQAYNCNKITAKITKKIEEDKEKAGVICFNKDINASYLIDDEDIVICLQIFCNCVLSDKDADKQLEHTINVIKVIQQSIELLGNVTKKEANIILTKLGLFDGTFRQEKQIKHIEHSYKVKVINGLLMFSIIEN